MFEAELKTHRRWLSLLCDPGYRHLLNDEECATIERYVPRTYDVHPDTVDTAVADKDRSFTLTGNGDVLEPEDGVIAIGSGGNFALAAARALMEMPDLSADQIARRAMQIASEICVYTNSNLIVETI